MQTPYFLIHPSLIERNLQVLRSVMDETGCKILLAQKCFSLYGLYPLIGRYLSGATASGLFEARLCHEEMPVGENHVFAPAFNPADIDELTGICDHIVFNSPRQLALYGRKAKEAGMQVGLRINPEHSTQEGHAIYDPCAPGSRLGTRLTDFQTVASSPELMELLDGLHFHTLCEQNSDDLESTLDVVLQKFGPYLRNMRWLNFGGGHHITRADYDIDRLKRCIMRVKKEFGLQVYLEPGEAVALNAGELHTTILEIQSPAADGIRNVIVDTSAACHMPDVIEMPYTPPLLHAEPYAVSEPENHEPQEGQSTQETPTHIYRLGGPTCLSGDIIGTYRFDHELREGEQLVFGDMAIYSMVKTNTFNGMPLPDIYIADSPTPRLWKHFSYADFKSRI